MSLGFLSSCRAETSLMPLLNFVIFTGIKHAKARTRFLLIIQLLYNGSEGLTYARPSAKDILSHVLSTTIVPISADEKIKRRI